LVEKVFFVSQFAYPTKATLRNWGKTLHHWTLPTN